MKNNQHKKTKKLRDCSCCYDGRYRAFSGKIWKKYWNKFVRRKAEIEIKEALK